MSSSSGAVMSCPYPTKAIRSYHCAEDEYLSWMQTEPFEKQVQRIARKTGLADSMPGRGSRGRYARGKGRIGTGPSSTTSGLYLENQDTSHFLPQIAQREHQILASIVWTEGHVELSL